MNIIFVPVCVLLACCLYCAYSRRVWKLQHWRICAEEGRGTQQSAEEGLDPLRGVLALVALVYVLLASLLNRVQRCLRQLPYIVEFRSRNIVHDMRRRRSEMAKSVLNGRRRSLLARLCRSVQRPADPRSASSLRCGRLRLRCQERPPTANIVSVAYVYMPMPFAPFGSCAK